MEKTKIQWTDATVNFWTGCRKVSRGCGNCYMYRDKERYGQDATIVIRTSDNTFYKALEWKDPKLIFTCSWSDFFIEEADQWRDEAWDVIRKTPWHTWQILTKRPERIMECLPEDWGDGWDNVWLGVSIESQKYLHRAEALAKIPAKAKFISAEPLLAEIDFKQLGSDLNRFDWCIIGGESGNNYGKYRYRECSIESIERIIADFQGTNVKVFVKQLGTHLAKQLGCKDRHGGDINEWPENLQIREFPLQSIPILKKTSDSSIVEDPHSNLLKNIIEMNSNVKNGAELLKMRITRIPTLVDPIIPKVGIISLVGTSDIGKSTFLLQLCCDVVLFDTFLDFPITAVHKSAIYVSTEDDMFAISSRLQRLRGCDEEKLRNLKVMFSTNNLVKEIDDELTSQKADVVVIDTFADVYPGEMNQVNKVRTFMNDYFELANKHQCLIIFNHHTGKYTEEKPPNKNNSLGSTGFEGKCRLVMELRPDYGDASKKHLCIVKGNYLPNEFKQTSFELSYDEKEGFQRTGNRASFDLLAKPKLFKPVANREVEMEMAMKLRKEKKSIRAIAETINIPKTTVGEWLKPLSDQEST